MKCAALLTLAFIGVVTGDGAWERNKEYTYKLVARTLRPSSKSENEFVGVISRAVLSIRPQSDDILIGQITRAEYGKVNDTLSSEWISDLDNRDLDDWPLNKLFKVHLQNGVIRSLSVSNSLTNYEINQLKVIVSLFQVDTNARNQIEFRENELPEMGKNNAIYKTMEPIVSGNCEMVYEISPIPDYLIQSHPEWVPLPELRGTGEFIEIVKSKNHKNCHETSEYLLDVAGRKDSTLNKMNQDDLFINEDRRIVISGSLQKYTIQSSVTSNKGVNGYDNRPTLIDYVSVTLQSVEDVMNRPPIAPESLSDLKNIGNLVYNYDSDTDASSIKLKSRPRLLATSTGSDTSDASDNSDVSPNSHQDVWSHCWTAFPAASTLCKSEFGTEYMDIDAHGCGFLGLGKQALCKFNFPGCVATPCYTVFYARSELCSYSFGEEYPVTRGGFEDCSPGFYRSRCCPRSSPSPTLSPTPSSMLSPNVE